MNHPQNTKIRSKWYHAIFENLRCINGPLFLRCWQLWWQICQSNCRTPFYRHVCHRQMASKYPCKHGSHEQLKKSLKPPFQFALRMNEATTFVTSFLIFLYFRQTDLSGLRSVLFCLSTISLSLSPAEGNFVGETWLAMIHVCTSNENAYQERRVSYLRGIFDGLK